MALCEGRCLLDRRFADRGNDIKVFYSHARGEDRRPTRRVADRGSDGVYHDPRDLEEIRRLRQRVRDLEEIRRLRQRVRDLELQRETRVKETESGSIVWDDVNEEEEHPFRYPHHLFFEPINHESLTDDETDLTTVVWDESDGEEGDNEGKDDEEAREDELKTSVIFDEILKFNTIAYGSITVARGDNSVVGGDDEPSLESQLIPAVIMESSKIESIGSLNNFKFQMEEICGVAKNMGVVEFSFSFKRDEKGVAKIVDIANVWDIKKITNIVAQNLEALADFRECMFDSRGLHGKKDKLNGGLNNIPSIRGPAKTMLHVNNGSNTLGLDVSRKKIFTASLQGTRVQLQENDGLNFEIPQKNDGGSMAIPCLPITKVNVIQDTCVELTGIINFIHNFGLMKTNTCVVDAPHVGLDFHMAFDGPMKKQEIFEWFKSILNTRSNVLFDPGGIGSELGKMSRKVEMNRVDVPFDPGGFDLEAKLEGEFFRRGGE